jgi:hypothetical protein
MRCLIIRLGRSTFRRNPQGIRSRRDSRSAYAHAVFDVIPVIGHAVAPFAGGVGDSTLFLGKRARMVSNRVFPIRSDSLDLRVP